MMRVLGSTTKRRCTAVGLALTAAAALAACAPAPAAVSTGAAGQAADAVAATDAKSGDILPFCPDQPTKVIFVKSAGGQVWSAIANAEFMAEAAKCKTIEATWYNGTTGQQGAIAATNAAVAQGNKVMVIIADFGTAQLASIRKATQAGVTVVPVVSDVGGQKGADYADQLLWDTTAIAENQARWLAANVKTGKVAFLGGQPGAPSTQKTFDAFKTAVTQLAPGIQLVPDTWVPTNWDAGQKRRAVAGLIAQNGDYAAFVSDYGASDIGAVQAVLDAGAPMPAFLNIGSSQGFVCAVHDHDIRWLGQDGSTRMTAAALRIALAEYEHKPSPEQNPYVLYTYADTVAGTTPACDPSISPDADLSSSLPADQLKALLGG